MVIGDWLDLFDTSWEGLHEVLPIVIAEESRMFTFVLSLPQWRCYRNFEPPDGIRTFAPDAGDHGKLFWSGFD